MTEDIMLYAKRAVKNYKVTIDKNPGTYGTVNLSSVTKPYGSEIEIDENEVTI